MVTESQQINLQEIDPLLKKMYPNVDLKSFIEAKVRMKNFIHYDENVGVDGIQFIGLPGSGKTSFAMLVCKDLMKEKNENILLSGDRFCEFRHFFRYPRIVKKIILFLPEGQELFFYNIPSVEEINQKYNAKGLVYEIKIVNLETFNINDYLTDETVREVFVIYDNHYQGPLLYKRAELWKRITKQLLERTVLLNTAITTLYNEAGILWQEGASDELWTEINQYAELIVECRKGLVRIMQLAQLETEVYHRIRKKLLWRVYRLGSTSKAVPSLVYKAAPFQSRSSYILMYGGLFAINNQTIKLTEYPDKWKIIPIGLPEVEDKKSQSNKSKMKIENAIIKLYDSGMSQTAISHIFDVSQQRVSQIINSAS